MKDCRSDYKLYLKPKDKPNAPDVWVVEFPPIKFTWEYTDYQAALARVCRWKKNINSYRICFDHDSDMYVLLFPAYGLRENSESIIKLYNLIDKYLGLKPRFNLKVDGTLKQSWDHPDYKPLTIEEFTEALYGPNYTLTDLANMKADFEVG